MSKIQPTTINSGTETNGEPMYKTVCKEIVSILEDKTWGEPIVKIHLPQRAKFERYLQAVLALRLKKKYEDTEIEYSVGEKHIDIYANNTCIELKTPNTNYTVTGVVDKTRPITKNIQSIIEDIQKLRNLGVGNGVVAFVLFPVTPDNDDYKQHVNKVISKLGNVHFCIEMTRNMLVFSCNI